MGFQGDLGPSDLKGINPQAEDPKIEEAGAEAFDGIDPSLGIQAGTRTRFAPYRW